MNSKQRKAKLAKRRHHQLVTSWNYRLPKGSRIVTLTKAGLDFAYGHYTHSKSGLGVFLGTDCDGTLVLSLKRPTYSCHSAYSSIVKVPEEFHNKCVYLNRIHVNI